MPFRNTSNKIIVLENIEQISVDGQQIQILADNRIYTCMEGYDAIDRWRWNGNWGSPFNNGLGISLPEKYKSWSISFSNPNEQKYQADGNGNKFKVYVGSIYLLSEDGTEIHFVDSWTPADWAYQFATPLRGRFVSENMSVSGSVVFLIGRYGDMFTRHVDFDVIGANPTLFYTYDTIPKYEGIFDREHPRKLPIADWQMQPKIKGCITSNITIYTTGEGNLARNLRVEGYMIKMVIQGIMKNLCQTTIGSS